MEQPSNLSAQEIRRHVEAAVGAQIAPLRMYMAKIAGTLADIVERLDRAEEGEARPGRGRALGPAPATGPDLTPALLAIAEGIRASHDAILGVDEHLGVGLLGFEARFIPSIEELVGDRLSEAMSASKANAAAVLTTLQAVAAMQDHVRENLIQATKSMERSLLEALAAGAERESEARVTADSDLQSSLHAGLAMIATGLETPAAEVRAAARWMTETRSQMTAGVEALGDRFLAATVAADEAPHVGDLARQVTALTSAVHQICGSVDEALGRQDAILRGVEKIGAAMGVEPGQPRHGGSESLGGDS